MKNIKIAKKILILVLLTGSLFFVSTDIQALGECEDNCAIVRDACTSQGGNNSGCYASADYSLIACRNQATNEQLSCRENCFLFIYETFDQCMSGCDSQFDTADMQCEQEHNQAYDACDYQGQSNCDAQYDSCIQSCPPD